MYETKCPWDYRQELKILLTISVFLIVLSMISSFIVLIGMLVKYLKKKCFQKKLNEEQISLTTKKKPKKQKNLLEHRYFTKIARHSIKFLIFFDLIQSMVYLPLVLVQLFVPNYNEKYSAIYTFLQLGCKKEKIKKKILIGFLLF